MIEEEELVDKTVAVDLEPYKIKNIQNFYQRNHPTQLNPYTPKYRKYWYDFAVKSVEGTWINDEGTHYWMPPKSFFYVNYLTLEDDERNVIHPRYRDIDRIVDRYITCADGFSGFEGDSEYTCNIYVKKFGDGTLIDVDRKKLTKWCYRPGTEELKTYVDPWTYLQRHYLIDHKPKQPLGRALWENPLYNQCLFSARFTGKDQPLDTLVYDQFGPKRLGDVLVGDQVYGADGKLANVVGIRNFNNQLQYRVTFADGRSTRCGEGHLWNVYTNDDKRRGRLGKVKPLSWIKDNYRGYIRSDGRRDNKLYIKYTEPIEYERKDLPIDPYFLGLWLGDGTSATVGITTMDDEVVKVIYDIADKFNCQVKVYTKNKNNKAKTYRINKGIGVKHGDRKLKKIFKSLNLFNNKHIPDEYKIASVDQRMELLRGFMDADGTVDKRQGDCSFVQKSEKLTDDICDLMGSLGISYKRGVKSVKIAGKDYSLDYHRVYIKTERIIFNLARKVKHQRTGHVKGKHRSGSYVAIVNIEPLEVMPSRCLILDNRDHLYLCDNYIVTHNSTHYFIGDFLHEWIFCGVNRREDLSLTQRKYLFAMASMDSSNLNRSAALIDSNLTRLPGRFRFPRTEGRKTLSDYPGPYYKNTIGTWKVGETVSHVEKDASGNRELVSSMVQLRVISPDKTKIVAGDRFRRIYIEEAGFLRSLLEVHANAKDSLRLGKKRVGALVLLGTSGDIHAFEQANTIFTSPEAYDMFPIPNHWRSSGGDGSDEGNRIGLFIPAYYVDRRFADENENQDIDAALGEVLKERARLREKGSSYAYDKEVMYHPIEPSEMMRPSGNSVLPKQEAQECLNRIEEFGLFDKRAAVGWLHYDKAMKSGIKFVPDVKKELQPIISFNTTNYSSTHGAFIQYETPVYDPPENLYHVIYDPAAQSGEGTSYHSVLVYKHRAGGVTTGIDSGIVGEWLGRLPTLEENWNMVVAIAKYFNAKIFPEYNTPGFIDWCKRTKRFHMLRGENLALRREISPKAKSNGWNKGFRQDARTKGWCLNQARDWLLYVNRYDEHDVPVERIIDTVYSPRLLQEIIYFDPDNGNYDHLSSLLGLQILLNALERTKAPEVIDKYDEDSFYYRAKHRTEYVAPFTRRARASILDF